MSNIDILPDLISYNILFLGDNSLTYEKITLLLLMACHSIISWGQYTILLSETFEQGNYNNWTSAGGSYTTTMETVNPSTGNYALKMVGSSGHDGGLIRTYNKVRLHTFGMIFDLLVLFHRIIQWCQDLYTHLTIISIFHIG